MLARSLPARRLHKGEWLALLTLTLLYLGASMLDEASEISEATQIKNNEGSAASLAAGRMWWSFPALVCDLIFLSWIYMSLVTMMKVRPSCPLLPKAASIHSPRLT